MIYLNKQNNWFCTSLRGYQRGLDRTQDVLFEIWNFRQVLTLSYASVNPESSKSNSLPSLNFFSPASDCSCDIFVELFISHWLVGPTYLHRSCVSWVRSFSGWWVRPFWKLCHWVQPNYIEAVSAAGAFAPQQLPMCQVAKRAQTKHESFIVSKYVYCH